MRNGNSVFVDDSISPYPDQWKLLASVQRVRADQVDCIVNDATRRGQVIGVRMVEMGADVDEPWMLPPSTKITPGRMEGPFPAAVELVLSNLIFIPKAGLPEPMLNRILRVAAFQNPDF